MTFIETTLMNGGPDFNVALVPDFGAMAPMRREVVGRLRAHGLSSETVDDVLLVVSELCTNAIQATGPVEEPVVVRVRMSGTAVIVEVENVGPPFEEGTTLVQRQTGPDSERGRGLVIVRAVAETLTLLFNDGRCTLRAVLRLA